MAMAQSHCAKICATHSLESNAASLVCESPFQKLSNANESWELQKIPWKKM